MGFTVSFLPARPSGGEEPAPASQELGDDCETLVMEACSALSDSGGSFHIGGFGSDEWPLDIAYDLSAFMEQLPSLMTCLRDHREGEVDMYPVPLEKSSLLVKRHVCIR